MEHNDAFTRWQFLATGAVGAVALATSTQAIAQTQRPLVKPLPTEVFIDHGLNQETRLETLHGYLTPSSHFFVRNHSATPVLDTPRAMATTCPCRTR